MQRWSPGVGLASVVFVGVWCGSVDAAIVDVYLHDFIFSTNPDPEAPEVNQITINTGDTVRWTWVANFHNVREVMGMPPLFSSPFTDVAGTTFTHTFDSPGYFVYICDIHGSHAHGLPTGFGMWGSVTVVPSPPGAAAMGIVGLLAMRRRRR
jgi:MYXO-CTERM domain-containing protein